MKDDNRTPSYSLDHEAWQNNTFNSNNIRNDRSRDRPNSSRDRHNLKHQKNMSLQPNNSTKTKRDRLRDRTRTNCDADTGMEFNGRSVNLRGNSTNSGGGNFLSINLKIPTDDGNNTNNNNHKNSSQTPLTPMRQRSAHTLNNKNGQRRFSAQATNVDDFNERSRTPQARSRNQSSVDNERGAFHDRIEDDRIEADIIDELMKYQMYHFAMYKDMNIYYFSIAIRCIYRITCTSNWIIIWSWKW